jgi:hypothetical protein
VSTATLVDLGPKKLNLLEGQYHSFTAGRLTVTVQCARYDAAYTVVLEQGSLRLDDLCSSYPTEQEACAVARLHCQMAIAEASR